MDREEQFVLQARPSKGCRVYVGNLSWNVKWQDLKDHMKQAGVVVHADGMEITYKSHGSMQLCAHRVSRCCYV
jgi:RNA recognition motif-containing protein